MKQMAVEYIGWGRREPVGLLVKIKKTIYFEYDPAWLRQGLELSPLKLPLTPGVLGPFSSHQHHLPGFIADCLPDGWGLLLMQRLFRQRGIQTASSLDHLAYLGSAIMGGLAFHPSSESSWPTLSLKQIAKEVSTVIHEKPATFLNELVRLGGSPHGARPKVLVQYDAETNNISNDPAGPGTPWLIKFQSAHELKDVPALECCYAQLAQEAGLHVAPTAYFDLGKDLAAFGTQRFDRIRGMHIFVHSLAGLLDVDFRIPSSINYGTYLQVTRFLTKDERQVRQAFRQCVFNVIFNNRDDHPKNFGFLLDQKNHWKLTPSFDLTFSQGPGGEHHMDICGEGNPGRAQLLQLAHDVHLLHPDKILDEVLTVAGTFKKIAKQWPIRTQTVNTVDRAIAANIRNVS